MSLKETLVKAYKEEQNRRISAEKEQYSAIKKSINNQLDKSKVLGYCSISITTLLNSSFEIDPELLNKLLLEDEDYRELYAGVHNGFIDFDWRDL